MSTHNVCVMHQSFETPTPMGPGNSGPNSKALVNTLHCGDIFMNTVQS